MSKIKEQKYVILTFMLATMIIGIVFGQKGFFPFGDKQIMIIDSWHQYYLMFQEFHHRLTGSESLLYSWNGGGGSSFLTMAAYYAMSPLNLLSVFVPDMFLREFFWMATVAKIALAGTLFSIYLRGLKGRNDLSITVFGILYAYSGFMIGYYWNTMWLDSAALLPLVMLGLHRLMDKKGYRLYVISLAIAIVSNFYIGFFICEFIALYFFILYFKKHKWQNFGHLVSETFRVVLMSILSIGLIAVVLVPIYFGMGMAYGHASGNPTEFTTYATMHQIIANLLIGVEPTIVDGLPNISAGILGIMFMVAYFVNKKVRVGHKLLDGGLVLFLLVSMNVNMLNFVWHGFHFPNQVPYRFSFIVSFLILSIGYEAFAELEGLSLKRVTYVILGFVGFILATESMLAENVNFAMIYGSLLLVLLYGVLILIQKKGFISMGTMVFIMLLLVMSESFYTSKQTAEVAGDSVREEYYPLINEVEAALAHLDKEDSDFYRIEMAPQFGTNDPLMYRYPGISQFASTGNSRFNDYTQKVGLPSDAGSNTATYVASTPSLNSMFGIRYILSKNLGILQPNEGYEKIATYGELDVMKNRYTLPMGFRTGLQINEWHSEAISPFARQELFYNLATGSEEQIYGHQLDYVGTYTNMAINEVEANMRFHYKNIDPSQTGQGSITYTVDHTDQYYLYMLNQNPTMNLTFRGGVGTHKTPRGITVDLGVVEAGETVTVAFDVYAAASGYFDLALVDFDGDALERQVSLLEGTALDAIEFTDTRITGVLDSDSNGYMYTSIPIDDGWHARINDKKVEIEAFADATIMLPIKPGVSTIELYYRPKGMILGLVISLISLTCVVYYGFWLKRENMKEIEADE